MQFVGGNFTLKKNGPALVAACKADDVEAAKGCLERCPYAIHFKDAEGLTPLHVAAASRQPLAVQLLLDQGAYVGAVDRWGRTPLVYATQAAAEAQIVQRDEAMRRDACEKYRNSRQVFGSLAEFELLARNATRPRSRRSSRSNRSTARRARTPRRSRAASPRG